MLPPTGNEPTIGVSMAVGPDAGTRTGVSCATLKVVGLVAAPSTATPPAGFTGLRTPMSDTGDDGSAVTLSTVMAATFVVLTTTRPKGDGTLAPASMPPPSGPASAVSGTCTSATSGPASTVASVPGDVSGVPLSTTGGVPASSNFCGARSSYVLISEHPAPSAESVTSADVLLQRICARL